ncbi:hypothetical protein BS50DRAFT_576475 [Corynespora cassiicola Philippines]|uniref:Uncharacterized protein n=1 Tax=Corynespora cassiicola Philippines TaxID=1448308 RepID=A0A2T2NEI9_CORCC|nr:hypothetical protein BS50DRAFT_576475 [Corynespora cassiicola Philippines]
MPSHHPSRISAETLKTVVSRYPATAPAALKQLDTLRYETIPSSIAARKSPGETSLTKAEVEKLVEWKL